MRAALLAALVLASIVSFPAASSAEPEGAMFYEDAEKDARLETFGLPAPAVPMDSPEMAPADLLWLKIGETDDAVVFTLGVQSMKTTAPYSANYNLRWSWHKVEFSVNCQRQELAGIGGGSGGYCYLNSYSEKEGYLDSVRIEAVWDVDGAVVEIPLRKVLMLDEDRRVPTKDDVLSNIHVSSRMVVALFGFATQVRDDMPDDRDKDFRLAIGDFSRGHIKLTTDDRVRVSNGGATTFVFQANITNSADMDDTVELGVANLPPNYNVTFQTPVRVPAEGSKRIAVLVSVPFGHDHGGHSSFNLTAESQRDPASRATLRLGVLHTPIPQPAGHHDELFLHPVADNGGIFDQVFTSGRATMNTEAPYEHDAPEAMATGRSNGGYYWDIPLEPALAMGLDFDLERMGELKASILGRMDGAASAYAELFLVPAIEEEDFSGRRMRYDVDDGILLADSDVQQVTLSSQGATDLALTLVPTSDADYIPYARGQNLVLRLQLSTEADVRGFCCLDGLTPSIEAKEFMLKLPLNEYHDRLTGVAEAALAIDLKADGPVEKPARPGTIMTYTFQLQNPMGEPILMDLDVAGNNADMGTIVPEGLVEVPAKGSVKVTLAVEVPHTADDGQEIEVLVFAHAQDDPSKMAVARTKTVVTKGDGAAPDETDKLLQAQAEAADNDSPGLGALGLVGAATLVALASRRRRT